MLYRENWKVSPVSVPVSSSFESTVFIHRGNSINHSTTNGALSIWSNTEILDLVATPSTMIPNVDKQALLQRHILDPLMILLFPATNSSQQPFTGTLKHHFESGLVLNHLVLYFPWYRVLDLTHKKIYGKPRFPSEH
ncbi:unnamed protein product [Merluccius merluccius]